jgi:hypothetical protein
MYDVASDLLDAVQAVNILSPTSFALDGVTHSVPGDPAGASSGMVSSLEQALYGFYFRAPASMDWGTHRPADFATVRRFVDDLSRANDGRGTQDPGWEVVDLDPDGRVVAAKDGVVLWVPRRQFEPPGADLRPGVVGRVRVGKEFREMIPGFYLALGDAREPDDAAAQGPLVRYYWNVCARGAPHLVRELTTRLNGQRIPFRLKTLRDPSSYVRADAAVLYLGWEAHLRSAAVVSEVRALVAGWLRRDVPRFSQAVAPGVGVAEDPRARGESFGQNRCRIVAEGLWQAFASDGQSVAARAQSVASAFARYGLDPTRPHLAEATSRREYARIDGGGAA